MTDLTRGFPCTKKNCRGHAHPAGRTGSGKLLFKCTSGCLHSVDPDPTPAARTTDPPTSHQAAEAVRQTVGGNRDAVLKVLREAGQPLADVQLVTLYEEKRHFQHPLPAQSRSGIRTRRLELVRMGLVERAGTVRIGNRDHIRWRATGR